MYYIDSTNLSESVIDSRKKRTLAAQDNSTQQLGDDVSGTSLFIEKRRGKAKQTSVRTTVKTLSKEELNELERQKESEAQSWYSRLQLLWINMLNGEEEAENEWLLQAEKLVEMFRETRKLFLAKGVSLTSDFWPANLIVNIWVGSAFPWYDSTIKTYK